MGGFRRSVPEIAGYTLDELLGSGSFGDVWRAHATISGAPVAIKVSRSADARVAELIRHEARVLAAIRHPGVVHVFHTAELPDGRAAMVHELLDGASLREALTAGRRFREDEALEIGAALLAALGAIHAAGFLHRDVSPDNIVLTARGAVLTDLGVAGQREPAFGGSTVPGQFAGKVGYMSPEQALGMSQSPRSDLWAAALVVGEMLTGRPILRQEPGETPTSVVERLLAADFDLSGIPPRFHPFLRACLAPDEGERPRDAVAAARLLGAAGGQARRPTPARSRVPASAAADPAGPLPARRKPAGARLHLLLVLSLTGGALLLFADPAWIASSRLAAGPGDWLPTADRLDPDLRRATPYFLGGVLAAATGLAASRLVERRAGRRRDEPGPAVADEMPGAEPRQWLSRTLMVEMEAYRSAARTPDERVMALVMTAAAMDWEQAQGPDDARKAMDHLVGLQRHATARRRSRRINYDRLLARGMSITSFIGGAVAIWQGVLELR